MHWRDVSILGWISLSAVAFNFQLLDMAANTLLVRWNAPKFCKVCRQKMDGEGNVKK